MQTSLRKPAATVPDLHGVGSKLPMAQTWPGGQSAQSPADVRLVAFENVPASQGNGMLVPGGQKWPLVHESGSSVDS